MSDRAPQSLNRKHVSALPLNPADDLLAVWVRLARGELRRHDAARWRQETINLKIKTHEEPRL